MSSAQNCAICRQPIDIKTAKPWQHKDARYPSLHFEVVEFVHPECLPPSSGDEQPDEAA